MDSIAERFHMEAAAVVVYTWLHGNPISYVSDVP